MKKYVSKKRGKKIPSSQNTSNNSLKFNGIPIQLYPEITILYRFMPLEAFEATIKSWSLKATLPYEANDPFEFTPQSSQPGAIVDNRANSPISSPPPFLCFSRKISTASMWGLYADSGKGVCLVFGMPVKNNTWPHNDLANTPLRIDELKCTNGKNKNKMANSLLLPVSYNHERVLPPENHNTDEQYQLSSINNWFLKLISTKDETWKEEDEVRLVTNYEYASSAENGKVCFSWPMNYLLGVVVGPRCKYSPAIIRKLLTDAYTKNKEGMNYFHNRQNKSRLIDNFIVSQAYYHWKNYEMECIPWGNRINGKEYTQLLAIAINRLQGEDYTTIDAITNLKQSKNVTSESWQEICEEVYKQNENTIIAMNSPIPTEMFLQSPITSILNTHPQ